MNRPSGHAITVAAESLSALGPAAPAKAAEPETNATLAYQHTADPAARVLNQLDGLTTTFERARDDARLPPHPAPAQNSAPVRHPALAEHAEEECLESYLQRYMQQLTGKKQEPAVTTPLAAAAANEKALEPEIAEQKPQRQPAQAPEDRLRITAMRELANDSARRAMAERSNTQMIGRTRTAYLLAKVVSLMSITLGVCYFATHSIIALATATVMFGVAAVFACRFALFCRKVGPGEELPAC
jgi:hypothetical protein